MTDSALHFEIGGFYARCECIELFGDRVEYCRAQGAYMLESGQSIDLRTEALAQFWQAMDEIGVWNWKESYDNPDVLDGVQWSLKLEHCDRRLVCGGSNSYPQNELCVYSAGSEFGRFIEAVRGLTGLPSFCMT